MSNFLEILERNKERESVIFREKIFTFGDLLNFIESYSNEIDLSGKSKIYSLISDYSPYAIAMLLTLYKMKKIIVPISIENDNVIEGRHNVAQVEAFIRFDANGKLLIKTIGENQTYNAMLKEIIDKFHSGIILFSSGSTGIPKAMVHDLDNLLDIYMQRKPKKWRILTFLMFDHIGGLNTLFNSLAIGATVVIPEKRDPEHICFLIEKYQVDLLPTSPTFLNLLLISEAHQRYDLSSLKLITYGTEPMPENLLKRVRSTFPKIRFLQTFGTSETGIVTTVSKSSDTTLFKIDDSNTEWKMVQGELWLRTKTQINGYLNYDNPFVEDGWFPTGDLVELCEDGYIKIVGRKKEVINVGGEKVLPQEVENVILELPEISDVVVYGEDNALTGQAVVSEVVPSTKDFDKKEIMKLVKKHCRSKLEPYKIPVKVYVTEALDYGLRFKKKRLKQ